MIPRKELPKIVYKNPHNYVYQQNVNFGSFEKNYYVTHCSDKAGVLVLRDESVLLIRQYRLLVDGLAWEIPGGKIDGGVTPEQTAIQECAEEAKINCWNLKPLLHYLQGLDAIYTNAHMFYTYDSKEEEFIPDPREVVSRHWVVFDQCVEMIRKGEINDSFTILALLSYGFFHHQGYSKSKKTKSKKMTIRRNSVGQIGSMGGS